MNKTLITLFITSILMVFCKPEAELTTKTDLTKYNLKGKVWKVQETTYNAQWRGGEYSTGYKKHSGHSYYEFNEIGNVVEFRSLDREGNTNWTNKYLYNRENIRTELVNFKDGEIDRKEISQIENGKIIKVKVYNKDGEKFNTYNYNYSGLDIISNTVENKNGDIIRTIEDEFHNGQITKSFQIDSLGKRNDTYLIRNKNNDLIAFSNSNPTDSIKNTSKWEYEYDAKNNWIKSYYYYENEVRNIVIRNIAYYDDSRMDRTEDDIIGMWYVKDDSYWFEFRKDKKYSLGYYMEGYRNRIDETGIWEVDFDAKTLTFRVDNLDNTKKLKFDFDGYQMVIYSMDGKEISRLEKR